MRFVTRRLTLDDITTELRYFEEKYGLPSERMAEAFTVDGVLRETEDFWAWDVAYGIHLRLTHPIDRSTPEGAGDGGGSDSRAAGPSSP